MKLSTKHRLGSYDLHFIKASEALQKLPEPNLIVTDRNIAKFIKLPEGTIILPAGEKTKSFAGYQKLIQEIAHKGYGRNLTLVALGGGVIGDLVGFAAATYLRGVRFIQIPTTLLAQVDSSVGGKVGIDLPAGKNLLGAFYPPTEVRIATDFLQTLPKRQVNNGMAEVLKYGFIMRPPILDEATKGVSQELVKASISCKIEVVEADELETTGYRAILNFGHTIAHALEAELGYKSLLHGEAVSIGMVAEAKLGENLGITAKGTSQLVEEILQRHKLPTYHGLLNHPDRLIPWMRRDKKRIGSQLAFSLLEKIGQCSLVPEVSESEVSNSLVGAG